MIYELLSHGRENARTGAEIARALGCKTRDVSRLVERERRAGKPICAAVDGEARGYYIAADRAELKKYCDSLYRRGGEIMKTRRAMVETLKQFED